MECYFNHVEVYGYNNAGNTTMQHVSQTGNKHNQKVHVTLFLWLQQSQILRIPAVISQQKRELRFLVHTLAVEAHDGVLKGAEDIMAVGAAH